MAMIRLRLTRCKAPVALLEPTRMLIRRRHSHRIPPPASSKPFILTTVPPGSTGFATNSRMYDPAGCKIPRFHAHRIARGDCHYCHSGGAAAAGPGESQTEGRGHYVPQ